MSKAWMAIIIVLALGVAGYFIFMGKQQMMPAPQTPLVEPTQSAATPSTSAMQQVIKLDEQNYSSESGTATLTEVNGKVMVSLDMTGAPTDVPQPAHIHTGSCPDVKGIVYPLTSVVNGKSETTLDVTFAQLAAQQPLGINVHKSVPESKVYVSCGNLALPMTAPTMSMAPAMMPSVNPAASMTPVTQTTTSY